MRGVPLDIRFFKMQRVKFSDKLVTQRVAALAGALSLPEVNIAADEIRRVVSVFRELRMGQSEDGRIKFKTPSGTMSTAEAISVTVQGIALAAHLGDGSLRRIVLYLAAAWAGFLLGQLAGDFLNLELFKVGKIHLLTASIGAWALLLAARWLAGQEPE